MAKEQKFKSPKKALELFLAVIDTSVQDKPKTKKKNDKASKQKRK